MTADEYLNSIVDKYRINKAGVTSQVQVMYPVIQQWADGYLIGVAFSGSIAKGTAISLATDADIFISLSSSTPDSLSEIYTSLYNALIQNGYSARKQNVSIGVSTGAFKIDLVPGKRQSQQGYDHSLYKYKTDTWTKTNIKTHENHVANSNRIQEIKLTKIWRHRNSLDFPSFYLELAVIDCLSGQSYSDLSGNFLKVLEFLASDFIGRRYVDPANSNNIISDDLSSQEKQMIQQAAQAARTKQNWSEIVQ
jgi:hypothetical protein